MKYVKTVGIRNVVNMNSFREILLTDSSISSCASKCEKLAMKIAERKASAFAEWLKYNDELFQNYITNKISVSTLYNIFINNFDK